MRIAILFMLASVCALAYAAPADEAKPAAGTGTEAAKGFLGKTKDKVVEIAGKVKDGVVNAAKWTGNKVTGAWHSFTGLFKKPDPAKGTDVPIKK